MPARDSMAVYAYKCFPPGCPKAAKLYTRTAGTTARNLYLPLSSVSSAATSHFVARARGGRAALLFDVVRWVNDVVGLAVVYFGGVNAINGCYKANGDEKEAAKRDAWNGNSKLPQTEIYSC